MELKLKVGAGLVPAAVWVGFAASVAAGAVVPAFGGGVGLAEGAKEKGDVGLAIVPVPLPVDRDVGLNVKVGVVAAASGVL